MNQDVRNNSMYMNNAKSYEPSKGINICLSCPMGKPTICICKNKGANQLQRNCEADQRLCFCNTDSF